MGKASWWGIQATAGGSSQALPSPLLASQLLRQRMVDAMELRGFAARTLPADPARRPEARQARLDALLRHDWVGYAKTPPPGPGVVLDYLSRYTHRVAISNQRIVAIDEHDVHLSVRSDDKGGKRVIAIDGADFVGRFLQHVLPLKHIRHFRPARPGAQNPTTRRSASGAGHACGQPPRPARTLRPSSSAWPGSKPVPARTAEKGAG